MWKAYHMKHSYLLCSVSDCIRSYLILNISDWNPSVFSHWQGYNKPISVWPLPIVPTSAALTTNFITQLCNHSKLPYPFYHPTMLGFVASLVYALCLECPSQPHCLLRELLGLGVSGCERIPKWLTTTIKATLQFNTYQVVFQTSSEG